MHPEIDILCPYERENFDSELIILRNIGSTYTTNIKLAIWNVAHIFRFYKQHFLNEVNNFQYQQLYRLSEFSNVMLNYTDIPYSEDINNRVSNNTSRHVVFMYMYDIYHIIYYNMFHIHYCIEYIMTLVLCSCDSGYVLG